MAKDLEQLELFKGDITNITKNINSADLLSLSESDLLKEIRQKWFNQLESDETWDSTQIDQDESHNLFCYHALFYIFRFLVKTTTQDDAYAKHRDYYEAQYKNEFLNWMEIGFPYTFEGEPEDTSLQDFRLNRV